MPWCSFNMPRHLFSYSNTLNKIAKLTLQKFTYMKK